MTVNISSSAEWQRILGSSAIVVTDFYADWCGPCKMIAPTFESLSTKYSKPGKITFCKVNTDNQPDVAQAHGVRAMPTFIIFRNGSAIETLQGANPPALTAAVEKAVRLASVSAAGASFKTPGRTLGGPGAAAAPRRGGGQPLGGRPSSFSPFNIANVLLTFFGLYVVSLFSFDPYKSAERSDFNVHRPRIPSSTGAGGQRPGGASNSARPSGSCPKCRTRLLSLFENGFASARLEPPVRSRAACPRFSSLKSTGSSLRPFSTTIRQLQGVENDRTSPDLNAPSSAVPPPSRPDEPNDIESTQPPPEEPPEPASAELAPEELEEPDDIESMVRQTRKAFGATLPKDYLNAEEYALYVRLYGPPLRNTRPEDVGMPIPDGLTENPVYDPSRKVLLRQNEDGELEEVEYSVNESPMSPMELAEETEVAPLEAADDSQSLPSDAGVAHVRAVAKNKREYNILLELQRDFEIAQARAAQEEDIDEEEIEEEENIEEEGEEEGEVYELNDGANLRSPGSPGRDVKGVIPSEGFHDPEQLDEQLDDEEVDSRFQRTHSYTALGHWRSGRSTQQLPQSDFVMPISKLLQRTDTKHIIEAAEKAFGGRGLPFSVATPGHKIEQKGVALDAVHTQQLTEIEADAYLAANLPGMYASVMSILVEVRKRLGPTWVRSLLSRGNGEGPRVLDVGGGGGALAAWEQVLKAEWETFALEKGEKSTSEPPGKKSVVVAADRLRHRISRFLNNTTFLPRLPDYLHSGPSSDALDGSESPQARKSFDVIICSHQMLQMDKVFKRKSMLDNLWEMLSPEGGVLIVMEKGHPRGFEAVADVRSRLLDEFIAAPGSSPQSDSIEPEGTRQREPGMILAPCTNHKTCPMYLTPGLSPGRKDFCHFSQRFILPPFLHRVLGVSDRNHQDIDFSFVAIQRGTLPGSTAQAAAPAHAQQDGKAAADAAFAGYERSASAPDALSLPRNVLPPLKRTRHVTMDLCTPEGHLERWTVPKSFSRQAYQDARKARWGDLWALGAKTRQRRDVRLGRAGTLPNDGSPRAKRLAAEAAREGGKGSARRPRVINVAADATGIYSAKEAGHGRGPAERRTKGGRKPKMHDLLHELLNEGEEKKGKGRGKKKEKEEE
ncbi:mitochondrial small ribosomal subunit Rsm22-domain-containing protein [Xylariaceae sp. FL0804]|nr:mitochondrial small ribosomal subunit Rsm22-domain-containing protein [Xylariaceae sp. FL0804]